MELQAHAGTAGALALTCGQAVSEEERQKRVADAEALAEKLAYINERIPTRVVQIMGSNAGAGSGEFHMYRQARRREQARIARMEEEAAQQEKAAAVEERHSKLQHEEEQRTAKRRAKRQKKKMKQKAARLDKSAGEAGPKASADEDESDSDDGVIGQAALD